MANILGGDVELTTGTGGLSLEQGVQVRDLWTSGRMDLVLNGWIETTMIQRVGWTLD